VSVEGDQYVQTDRKDLESQEMTMRSFAWVISSAPDAEASARM